MPTSGIITSGITVSPLVRLDLDRRLEDGAGLHLVDLGEEDAEPAAAQAQHRVGLVQLGDAAAHRLELDMPAASATASSSSSSCGRNSCSGGSSRRMVTGRPRHDLEQLDEVVALHRQDLGQRLLPALGVAGQDHLLHGDDAVGLEEHVLGAAQADALGPEADRGAGVAAGSRRWSAP